MCCWFTLKVESSSAKELTAGAGENPRAPYRGLRPQAGAPSLRALHSLRSLIYHPPEKSSRSVRIFRGKCTARVLSRPWRAVRPSGLPIRLQAGAFFLDKAVLKADCAPFLT